ncbi:hypothetical protein MRB53_037900 [Persea americana]|nr:hypothetical protein MRB53_037900 [Persea americana]
MQADQVSTVLLYSFYAARKSRGVFQYPYASDDISKLGYVAIRLAHLQGGIVEVRCPCYEYDPQTPRATDTRRWAAVANASGSRCYWQAPVRRRPGGSRKASVML